MMKQNLEEIKAFFAKDSVSEGKMTFEGVFHLDGRFDGEILGGGTLILGETAVVRGKLGIHTLVVKGLLEGKVYVKGRTEIHSTGKVCGTLFTPILTIDEGGILDGDCKMDGKFATAEDSGGR